MPLITTCYDTLAGLNLIDLNLAPGISLSPGHTAKGHTLVLQRYECQGHRHACC